MMIYAMFAMILLMGFTSLAVDWGRVETAKTELQNATDAAARYASTGLNDSTYATKAINAAANNYVDGSPLVLTSGDVTAGTWNSVTRAFTPGGSTMNAVRVKGHRTAAGGNAVPLLFARAIGRSTCDINTTSIATQAVLPYSMVALNSIAMTGTSTIARASSESGSVIVASNGSWSMSGAASITGDVLYRTTAPTGTVTGSATYMSADIAYPVVTTPGGTTNYGAVVLSSGSMPIAGNYAVTQCTITGTASFTLTGDTNLYCSGSCTFSSNANITTNGYKFTIYMTNASTITLNNNLPLNLIIYGPTCTMSMSGSGLVTGSFVCKTLTMSNCNLRYSASLPIPVTPTGGGSATVAGGVSMLK